MPARQWSTASLRSPLLGAVVFRRSICSWSAVGGLSARKGAERANSTCDFKAEVYEEAVFGLGLGLGFWLRLHGCGGCWSELKML